MENMFYQNRQEAGYQLAQKLIKYRNEHPIIIALPRGGVVIGYEVSKALKAPLDVIVPRKIGAPFNPEFGIGAIAPNNVRVLDNQSIKLIGISEFQIEEIIQKETQEMNRRIQLYRKNLAPLNLKDKTVIIVDDGIATGVSTRAAVLSVKHMNPKKIILAVPVCPPDAADKFRKEVDEFLTLQEPLDFYAVGAYYSNFSQTTDDEVIALLEKAKNEKY